MLNKYILGNKMIETTEEKYLKIFKDMGYEPYIEEIKVSKSVEEKSFKPENDTLINEDKNFKKNKKI